jgi:CheY-like chemotaxis protein
MNQRYPLVIVDDDPDDQETIQESFKEIGWKQEIILLNSGHALIEYLETIADKGEYPSLIVLDYNMPKMTGEDILNWMKAHPLFNPIKLAFYSSGMSQSLKDRLISLGAHCCFQKPTNLAEARVIAQEIIALTKEQQRITPS